MRPTRWLLVGSILVGLAACAAEPGASTLEGDVPNPVEVAPISGDQLCDAMSSVGLDAIAGAPIVNFTPETLGGMVNTPGGVATCAALSDDPAIGVNGIVQFLNSPDGAGLEAYSPELHRDGVGDDAVVSTEGTPVVVMVLTGSTLVSLNSTPADGHTVEADVALDALISVLDNLGLAH